jgi:hypothetical protein
MIVVVVLRRTIGMALGRKGTRNFLLFLLFFIIHGQNLTCEQRQLHEIHLLYHSFY